MHDMLKQSDQLAATIATIKRMYGLMPQLTDTTHHITALRL
jgi:RND superfamily putative drug exporter